MNFYFENGNKKARKYNPPHAGHEWGSTPGSTSTKCSRVARGDASDGGRRWRARGDEGGGGRRWLGRRGGMTSQRWWGRLGNTCINRWVIVFIKKKSSLFFFS